MAHSPIVDVLAQRPEHELKRLRDDAAAQQQRLAVEIEQLDEAMAKQSRKRGSKPSPRSAAALGTTRERVLRIIRKRGQASPAEIVASSHVEGAPLGKGSVYNMLKTLLDHGDIRRVAEGMYVIATDSSTNGSSPGPSANGSSTAATQASPQTQNALERVGT